MFFIWFIVVFGIIITGVTLIWNLLFYNIKPTFRAYVYRTTVHHINQVKGSSYLYYFSSKVLSVLWDLELEEVEDILEEFVNKSLLFVDNHNKPYLYYLHDLQLDFLVEQNRTQLEVSQNGALDVKLRQTF